MQQEGREYIDKIMMKFVSLLHYHLNAYLMSHDQGGVLHRVYADRKRVDFDSPAVVAAVSMTICPTDQLQDHHDTEFQEAY